MTVKKEDCDFYLWTAKTPPIKNLIEVLRGFLTDGRLKCDKNGIKLIEVDSKKAAVIQMELNANVFEEYYCNTKKDNKSIDIGINIEELFKVSKTIDTSDTLKLFVKKDKPNKFGIETHCKEENNRFTVYLNTIDINNNNFKLPKLEYDNTITMSSSRFQKICKNFDGSTDKIEIRCSGSEVIFRIPGSSTTMENIIKPMKGDKDSAIISKSKEIRQGIFKSKYLSLFSKCSDLNNLIEINIANDQPIILKSDIASLGFIRLCLGRMESDDDESEN